MPNSGRLLLVALLSGLCPASPVADQEGSNFAHVAAAPHGRCYARSAPDHVRDPHGQPRQQGITTVWRVEDARDVQVHEYPWFSQQIFVHCNAMGPIVLVRVGPWHRGHVPSDDHLAIAFYEDGRLLRRYSTLEIAGGPPPADGNVAVSVSHYSVFAAGPEMVKITASSGFVFEERWLIMAETVDGRRLTFDMSGQLLP